MSRTPWRLVAIGILGGAALVGWGPGGGHGQQPAPPAGRDGEDKLAVYYAGTETCAMCHTDGPKAAKAFLCRLTEFKEWRKGDKHQDAYKALLCDRGKRMGERLGYDADPAKWDACLTCHGVLIRDKKVKDESTKDGGFTLDDGVSCVVCHGPHAEWVKDHWFQVNKWRALSRETKESQYGMTDLWDPARRAGLCASCHIGNAEEGKVVTHEMYAAGHPPLPSFELAAFGDEMPRHWQLLREKPPEVQKILGFDGKQQEQTKLVLVGAAVSLRTAMLLLADDADRSAKAKDADDRGLDFASFDCYACHHDLKSPSWRQARGFEGKPGRPSARSWSAALVRLAVVHAAESDADAGRRLDEFDRALKRVHDGFGAQPLGDPAQVGPAARDLARWAGDLAARVDRALCDAGSARRVLRRLPALYENKTVDFDSARELAWALRAMYRELEPSPDREIAAALDALGRELRLDLPPRKECAVSQDLAKNLEALNDYKPEAFKAALAQVAAGLGGR
jgi:hypothetical protein